MFYPSQIEYFWLYVLFERKNGHKDFSELPQIKKKLYWGNHFWARGYFVNTVGLNEDMIRRYVKYQEKQERESESRNPSLF